MSLSNNENPKENDKNDWNNLEHSQESPSTNSTPQPPVKSVKKNKTTTKIRHSVNVWVEQNIKLAWKRYVSLTNKELKVLFNDKSAMLIAFAIPIIVILILTFGISDQLISDEPQLNEERMLTKEIPNIGLIDYDTSEGFPDRDLSQELVDKFIVQRDNGMCNLFITNNQSELELMMGEGKLNSFVIIPNLFEFNLSIHIPVIVTVVFDSIDTMRLQSSQEIIDFVITTYKNSNNFTGVFKTVKEDVGLPERAVIFFAAAPYLIPLIIFGIGALTSTQCIVADVPKDRMVLTPTNKREMLAAKVTANLILMQLLGLIFMGTSALVGLQLRGTYFDYFIVLLLLALNAVIVGAMISAISSTPLSAFQYFIFMFIFQTIVLFFVQDPTLTNLMPIQNGYILVMSVLLRGQNWWSVRDTLWNLIAETIIIYLFAYLAFKKQKNML